MAQRYVLKGHSFGGPKARHRGEPQVIFAGRAAQGPLMPLIALWESNSTVVDQFSIEQVVATAGNGELKDGSLCSTELRAFLSQVLTPKLATYVERCLSTGFAKSGMVLQDLINELGRRLDFAVENGRYQGTTKAVGFDGNWKSPEGRSIVIEVKTIDAYRISLDKIAEYREKLITSGRISKSSSILIVVGRDDTGELEAQVRGSRHAWDIRLLSIEALLKLVQLKENAQDAAPGKKIRELLFPMEYTRLDQIIDVMFTTATDVETVINTEADLPVDSDATEIQTAIVDRNNAAGDQGLSSKGTWEFTDSRLLQEKREEILQSISQKIGAALIKRSRALYWDASHDKRVACSISKRYTKPGPYRYWYAFHPQWDEFLRDGKTGLFVLGCMDQSFAFSIPWEILNPLLPYLNTTTTDRSTYWHIHIGEDMESGYYLVVSKKEHDLPLRSYIQDVTPKLITAGGKGTG
jgi:hypothetical protein